MLESECIKLDAHFSKGPSPNRKRGKLTHMLPAVTTKDTTHLLYTTIISQHAERETEIVNCRIGT